MMSNKDDIQEQYEKETGYQAYISTPINGISERLDPTTSYTQWLERKLQEKDKEIKRLSGIISAAAGLMKYI